MVLSLNGTQFVDGFNKITSNKEIENNSSFEIDTIVGIVIS